MDPKERQKLQADREGKSPEIRQLEALEKIADELHEIRRELMSLRAASSRQSSFGQR